MNSVVTNGRNPPTTYGLKTLTSLCKQGKETAFIGCVGFGPKHSLYLIAYNGIVLAGSPDTTWTGSPAITVDRFVDVEITVIEKELKSNSVMEDYKAKND